MRTSFLTMTGRRCGRAARFAGLSLTLALLSSTVLAAGQTPADGSAADNGNPELRAGAWSKSIALEKQGQLRRARDLLTAAWGLAPDSYEVSVRIAWLSLQMDDLDTAQRYYERSRTLPGASIDATRGLASTWARRGFIELDSGHETEAREDFQRALEIYPKHEEAKRGLDLVGRPSFVMAQVWAGYQDMSMPGSDWYGLSVFGQLGYQANDWLRFALAYRRQTSYADMPVLAGGPGTGQPPRQQMLTQAYPQDEIYLGVGTRSAWFDFDFMGLAVLPSVSSSRIFGGASSVRIGRKLGLLLDASYLRLPRGLSREQVSPRLYWWPGDKVGFAGGLNATFDDAPTAYSAVFGTTWFVFQGTRLDAEVFSGSQRTPVSIVGAQVLNIQPEMTSGANLSLLQNVRKNWRLGVQGDIARVRLQDKNGTYAGLALGLQWDTK